MENPIDAAKKLIADEEKNNLERVGKAIQDILLEEGYELVATPMIHIDGRPVQVLLKKKNS